ncbi:probable G-protein coupled receptor 101 [Ornithorhynchus anatinus]|uniref:probable G-protein coupled receptor 101 n=1 Tax=Ornithorhynchus anatinus TaxID=9258 RepID=UPI0010A76D2E|nr:probable G-protein coupled receptor 101 [Ornithorhynchus anatinus]
MPLDPSLGNSTHTPADPGSGNNGGGGRGGRAPLGLGHCVVRILLLSALVCLSLLGNVALFVVFQRKPQLLQVANRFIFNLLVADLLQTVLVIPWVMAGSLPALWPLDQRLCATMVTLMHLFAFASVNTIIVVSVDRYLAIIHPLSYPSKMTPQRGNVLILGTWLCSVIQSTPPLYGWGQIAFDWRNALCTVVWGSSASYAALSAASSFLCPVAIMLGCYGMVFRAARRQNALVHPMQAGDPEDRVDNLEDRTDESSSSGSSTTATSASHPAPRMCPGRSSAYHCKAARVIFIIIASYILGMGPYSILSIVSSETEAAVPQWAFSVILLLFFLQCCIHPYIYGYMHKSIKKEFVILLFRFFCKKVQPQNSTSDPYFTVADGRTFPSHFSTTSAWKS